MESVVEAQNYARREMKTAEEEMHAGDQDDADLDEEGIKPTMNMLKTAG
jgi:hypothetical protein